jgi:crotonobetainyl-CoA:carnitine CoA-transferase CaiB-like acyl-CoA transferase
MKHPLIEDLKLTGSPLKLSKTPVTMDKYPPLYGEHTEEVLQQLGYSKEQIFDFKQSKVI